MFFKFFERFIYFFFDVQYDWEIGFSKSPVHSFLTNTKVPKIKWFKMPKNVFWADPFAIKRNGVYYLFYEELNKIKGYGTIKCMVLNTDFKILENKIVLDEGIHFSYPFLIEDGSEIYMLPETNFKNKLSIYQAKSFPYNWEEVHVLLNLPAEDSIFFKKENRWYLIYSRADRDKNLVFMRSSEDGLFCNWENCLEVECEREFGNARSGGGIFTYEGKLYRPTQNCTNFYGEEIILNEIKFLNHENFKENIVKTININSKNILGFHTISSCENITFVDRRRYRLFFNFFKKIIFYYAK